MTGPFADCSLILDASCENWLVGRCLPAATGGDGLRNSESEAANRIAPSITRLVCLVYFGVFGGDGSADEKAHELRRCVSSHTVPPLLSPLERILRERILRLLLLLYGSCPYFST